MSVGQVARIAGLVPVRQRPGTAKGTVFMTLEDETGIAHVILWEHIFRKFRCIVFGARMVGVKGILQKENEVIHVNALRLVDLTPELMGALADLPSGRTAPGQNLWRHPRDVRVLPNGRNFH